MKIKQLIFVVEANVSNKSDSIYIKTFIDYYYKIEKNIVINYIYMNGKNNYNKTKIINKINQFVKRNNNGENIVFYCIDTDNINSDRQHFDSFLNVSNFCKANKYQLIWFCYDIENVFLKRKVEKCDKKKMAVWFIKNIHSLRALKDIELSKDKVGSNCTSNIVNVLNNYLYKKSKN